MSAVYKQVWQFGDVNGATFSETHYITSENASAAANMDTELVTARLNMLDVLFTLQRIRSTNINGSRDTGNRQYGLKGLDHRLEADIASYPASTAAVMTLTGATGGSRRWWIRGLNEDQIYRADDSGEAIMSKKFTGWLIKFVGLAASRGMGLRRLTPTPNTPENYRPIVGIAPDTSGQRTVLTLASSPGWPSPQEIIIYKVNQKDYAGLNGKFMAVTTVDRAVTINYKCPPLPASPVISGTARKAEYAGVSVYAANGVGLHHFGDHQTRSPLFGSRGAKRAARLRTRS